MKNLTYFFGVLIIFYSCGDRVSNTLNECECECESKSHTNEDKKPTSDHEYVNLASVLMIEVAGKPISRNDTARLKKAISLLNKALAINAQNETALSNKVQILCKLSRFRDALGILEGAVAVDNDFAEGMTYQGFIYERIDMKDSAQIKYKQAYESYNRRIDRNNSIEDEIARSFILLFHKGSEAAINEINRIVENNPTNDYAKNIRPAFSNFNREEFINKSLGY